MSAVDVLCLVTGAVLAAVAATGLVALLRIRGLLDAGLAAGVLAAGEVIVLLLALSPMRWVTRGGVLGGEALVAGAVVAGWQRAGRPGIALHLPSGRALRAAARGHPAIALAALAAAALLTVELVLGLIVVPNEPDSLLYHLMRSALVLQRGTVFPGPPHLLGDPAVANPPNGEVLVAWTMVLSHTDRFAALVQWLAVVGIAGCVLRGARLLGASPAAALLAAAATVLAPELLLQSATPQNDALLCAFLGCAAVFAIGGLREQRPGMLVIAGLATGLAVGTKVSALVVLPWIALLVVLAVWRQHPPPRLVVAGVALALAGIAATGAAAYVANLARTGDPLGGLQAATGREFTSAGPALDAGRALWGSLVEAPGLPLGGLGRHALGEPAQQLFAHVRGRYYGAPPPVRVAVDEDQAGLGLVGLLVLVPTVALALVVPGGPGRRLVAGVAVGCTLTLAVTLGYSPDDARLLLPGLLLAMPLLAAVAVSRWGTRALVALAIAGAVPVALGAPARQLVGAHHGLLAEGRRAQQLTSFEEMGSLMDRLDRVVPPLAPVGFLVTPDFTDSDYPAYALFDAHLRRRVVPLPAGQVTPARIRALGLAGVVVWPAKCRAPGCRLGVRGLPHRPLGSGAALLLPARGANRAPG